MDKIWIFFLLFNSEINSLWSEIKEKIKKLKNCMVAVIFYIVSGYQKYTYYFKGFLQTYLVQHAKTNHIRPLLFHA